MAELENYEDFEQAVGKALEQDDWQVTFPPRNNQRFDIEAAKGSTLCAVQVKNYKRKVNVAQVQQFLDFLDLPMAARFHSACLVSASGFSAPAVTMAEQRNDHRLRLGTLRKGKLLWLPNSEVRDDESNEVKLDKTKDGKTYIGVFTCKGGVGKTTVSAHLAGAFALTGYDVALIDLDPQKNLNNLLPEGIYLKPTKDKPGNTINVFYHDEWNAQQSPEKIVICDCSPDFDRNPVDMMAKLHYCIIPTTLNPLGVNKNGHVLISTLEKIRSVNKHAHLFVLINNYFDDDTQRSREGPCDRGKHTCDRGPNTSHS